MIVQKIYTKSGVLISVRKIGWVSETRFVSKTQIYGDQTRSVITNDGRTDSVTTNEVF